MVGGAMTNAHVARLSGTHKAALPLPRRRKFAIDFIRIFSTCASPYIYSSTPFIYPSSLVLSVHITASDVPQCSDEWFAFRNKLTSSTFRTASGIWKGNPRYELWYEKVFALDLLVIKASKNGAFT